MGAKDCLQKFFHENKALLIVDDTIFNIESLSLMFRNLVPDIQIDSACNGEECLKKVKESWRSERKRYHLITMDINMPVLDGNQATRTLKDLMAVREIPNAPIVCNTAYHGRSPEFNDYGYDGFIPKPITLADLKNAIINLMEEGWMEVDN